MASCFRRKWRDAAGKVHEAKHYTVAFTDHSDPHRAVGIVRQVRGYEHVGASQELGNKLEKLGELRAANEPMPPELRRYVEGLPAAVRRKLAKWGCLSVTAEAAGSALTEHVTAYEQALRDGVASRRQKGRPATPQHVQLTGNRIRAVIDGIRARTFADIDAGRVARYLRERQEEGLGGKSAAHYFGALAAFLAWAVRQRLLPEHPLRDVSKPDAAVEKRHARRALERDEVKALLDAARLAPERFNVSGEERYWLYRLAVETGFRAGELRGLTRASLALDAVAPSATVLAAFAKNRRDRTVPLSPDTAAGLSGLVGNKLPNARVFRLPRKENIVKMLRGDLERAGVAYVDDAGRYADFHSLRVTFATNLIAAGVDVKTAQELLGHSTPTMTLNVYAKTLRGSHRNAISRMPTFGGPRPMQGRATGTYDTPITASETAQNGVQSGALSVRDGAHKVASNAPPQRSVSVGNTIASACTGVHEGARAQSVEETPPTGFEPVSPA